MASETHEPASLSLASIFRSTWDSPVLVCIVSLKLLSEFRLNTSRKLGTIFTNHLGIDWTPQRSKKPHAKAAYNNQVTTVSLLT